MVWLNSAEFSFLATARRAARRRDFEQNYNRTLFIALGTLIATPLAAAIRREVSAERRATLARPRLSLPEVEGEGSRVLIIRARCVADRRDVAAYLETSGWCASG